MFRITHTTPKRALLHLRRLRKQGDDLLAREILDIVSYSGWTVRTFMYLRKISEDPSTFDRPILNTMAVLSPPEAYRPESSIEEISQSQKKHVRSDLVTLAGAIEQLEAFCEE
jgi:hypothetical protein